MQHVAPYVGAWIETIIGVVVFNSYKSHPTWVRGLKQKENLKPQHRNESHPTWVRGLKQSRMHFVQPCR